MSTRDEARDLLFELFDMVRELRAELGQTAEHTKRFSEWSQRYRAEHVDPGSEAPPVHVSAEDSEADEDDDGGDDEEHLAGHGRSSRGRRKR